MASDIHDQSSILNTLHGTAVDIAPSGLGQVVVLLKIADQSLLSRITQKSADYLKLKAGLKVVIQAKSVALF